MTLSAFILIFISVFLHAGWNFISKAGRPSGAFYLVVNIVSILILLPFLLVSKVQYFSLPPVFWWYVAASVFFEFIYVVGLFQAYKRNDISMAYPMIRAVPVLLIAVITLIFRLGAVPGKTACAGFIVVALGCFILPQKDMRSLLSFKGISLKALGPIFLAAVGTTGYTIMDSCATDLFTRASSSGKIVNSGAYLCIVEIFLTLALAVLVFCSKKEKTEFFQNSIRSFSPCICGVFYTAAYLLVLAAMGMVSNVSFLQAFRQMSLPLGVAAGIFFLHEKVSGPKLAGTFLVVCGLILTVIK
ncbi:MAG: hypothetical protein J6S53_02530 [Lentisphaeria bacterium]|nr:hypothetical protein [Lentisphaeria bacterium]